MTVEEDPFAPEMAMLRMTHFGVRGFKLTHHPLSRMLVCHVSGGCRLEALAKGRRLLKSEIRSSKSETKRKSENSKR